MVISGLDVSQFKNRLAILYQSGETHIWYYIIFAGAFHLRFDVIFMHCEVEVEFAQDFAIGFAKQVKVVWKYISRKIMTWEQNIVFFNKLSISWNYNSLQSQIYIVYCTIKESSPLDLYYNYFAWSKECTFV